MRKRVGDERLTGRIWKSEVSGGRPKRRWLGEPETECLERTTGDGKDCDGLKAWYSYGESESIKEQIYKANKLTNTDRSTSSRLLHA